MNTTENKTGVYYDGDCGFCNASVAFILKNRKSDNFLFIPLQAKQAEKDLGKENLDLTNLDTIYVRLNGKIYDRSSAVLRVSKQLKFPYSLAITALVIPKKWRDFVYNWIAKRRLKLSTQKCFLPNQQERQMFIH